MGGKIDGPKVNTTQRSWSNYQGPKPYKSKVGSSFYKDSPEFGPGGSLVEEFGGGNKRQRSWDNYEGSKPIKSWVGTEGYGFSTKYGPGGPREVEEKRPEKKPQGIGRDTLKESQSRLRYGKSQWEMLNPGPAPSVKPTTPAAGPSTATPQASGVNLADPNSSQMNIGEAGNVVQPTMPTTPQQPGKPPEPTPAPPTNVYEGFNPQQRRAADIYREIRRTKVK